MNKKPSFPAIVVCAVFFIICLCAALSACHRQATPTVMSAAQYQDAKISANASQGPINPGAKNLYDQAMELYRVGNFGQAADMLGQAAQLGSGTPLLRSNALVYQADALRNADRCTEVFPVGRQVIAEFPERWEAYLIVADCYLQRDEYEKARQVMLDCLKVAPETPEAANGLAGVERHLGDYPAAVEHSRLAYRLSGKDEHRLLLAENYLELGRQREKDNDRDCALTAYFIARELNQNDPLPEILIGRILLNLDFLGAARKTVEAGRAKLRDAAAVPKEAFMLNSTAPANGNMEEFVHMAEFYSGREQFLEAAQQLEYALNTDPRRPELWLKLGCLRAEKLRDPLGGKECLHALWVLDGQGERVDQLTMALALTAAEPPETSPGFTLHAEVGTEYNQAERTINPASGPMPCGRRIYFALRLGKAGGEHRLQWQVRGPDGKPLEDLQWSMTFFGGDFSLLESGMWYNPGMYEVTWLMDGAVRSRQTFELRN